MQFFIFAFSFSGQSFSSHHHHHPLITAIGRSLTVFLLIPAAWPAGWHDKSRYVRCNIKSSSHVSCNIKSHLHVSTTSVTFLYDSGACNYMEYNMIVLMRKGKTCTSSITNLGEATLIDIPFLANASSTSS